MNNLAMVNYFGKSDLIISDKKNYYVENNIKYLRIQEYVELEKGIKDDFHKMLVRFLFETAARISEALEFDIKDIDYNYNKVIYPKLAFLFFIIIHCKIVLFFD